MLERTASALALLMTLCVVGCTPTKRIETSATAQRQNSDQILVSVKLTRGDQVMAAPKVLCNTGESASVEMVSADEYLRVDMVAPPAGTHGPVKLTVNLERTGQPPIVDRLDVPVSDAEAPDHQTD
ncbi:MAG: hypothetical protein MK101_02560 [Phycisphaerales bacterium]|nr:hypothetical protein [Phycisphaerales bacterium]